MLPGRSSRFAPIAFLFACIVLIAGCGSGPPAPRVAGPVPGPMTLQGNWLLSGTLPQQGLSLTPPPADSLVLDVSVAGNTVVADGSFALRCDNGTTTLGGTYGAVLTGSIAGDGSFTITQAQTTGVPPVIPITVKGTVPSAPEQPWSGTYTISKATTLAPSACVVNRTAAFTAAPVGDVTGVYAGAGPLLDFDTGALLGSNTSVTLNLQQDATLYSANAAPVSEEQLALSGTIAVSGLTCFTHGSMSTTVPSLLLGATVRPIFTMDDGSSLTLEADLMNTAADSLRLISFRVSGGACSGLYFAAAGGWVLARS